MPGLSESIVSENVVVERPGADHGHLWQRLIRATAKRFIPLLARLPGAYLRTLVVKLVSAKTNSSPPEDALRLLFQLDHDVYLLQGEVAKEYEGGIHPKHRLTKYHDFFVDRIRSGDIVLDVGCGIGAVAYDVAVKTGAQVHGIDLSAENVEIGRQRYAHPRVEIRQGDVLALEAMERFDVIILSNVLEHLPNRSDFLQRLKKITQATRFLIRLPLFERDWRVPLKRELGVEWRLDESHETEYTLESFEQEMHAAGLIISHLEVRWGEIWAELVTHDS